LLSFDQRSCSAQGKKCKLECKLSTKPDHASMSDLALAFTLEDLQGYLTLRAAGLTRKTVIWLEKAAELLWNVTKGTVSISTLQNLRNHVLAKYRDI
jgi:hypothetical protein